MTNENTLKLAIRQIFAISVATLMVLASVLPAVTETSHAFSGKKGSSYTVHDGGQIVYGSGAGGYSNSRKCDLGDELGSRYSYCVQPAKASPATGSVTVDKVVTDDNDTGKWNALRNIVYYSPSYPGYDKNVKDIKGSYYTGNFTKDWAIAHLALSYVYDGRPSDMATWGGTKASDLGDIWTKAKKLGNALWKDDSAKDDAVPDSFKVFISYMKGVQDMVVGYLESPGYLKIKKSSNRTSITKDNDCYDIKGAEYTVYSDGKSVGTLTIKDDGSSNTLELPEGSYTIKESKAPKGYAIDTESYKVKIESEETTTESFKDEPITDLVNLLLTKQGKNYPYDHGEGDAALEGAVYRFDYYDGQYDTADKAADSGKATATWYLKTDANGKISGSSPKTADGHTSSAFYKDKDGKIAFPLGTYVIQEVSASTGYLVNSDKLLTHVKEDGTDKLHVKTYNEAIKGTEEIIRGGVKLAKIDNDLDEAYAQGDATLEGAEFTIYNQSTHSIKIGDKEINKGDAAITIQTDASGIATSAADALPYGTYLVKETKPSSGYLLNEKWSRSFSIRKNGEIVDLSEDQVREAVIRGGVQIIKRDKELQKSEALGGATLNDIEMTIKNVSGRDVVVRSDINDSENKINWKELSSKKALFEAGTIKRVKSGEDIGKIVVHWNEEKKAYTAETLADDLPYGTYTIRESRTNKTYQRTDKTEHLFKIREDGQIVSYDDGNNELALTFDNYVYRADVQGTKIGDGDSLRFAYVPFKITAASSGETHVVVTDQNGFFSTKDRRAAGDLDEDEAANTSRSQNPFDDLLETKNITKSDLIQRAEQIKLGVFFGTGEFGNKAPMITGVGALPYDTYVIEELRCEGNQGYSLQKFSFTVDEKTRTGVVDLETITDDLITIGTTAKDEKTKSNLAAADKEVTIIDTVTYTNLIPGKEYTLHGTLMNQETGEELLIDDKPVTSEKKFTPSKADGSVNVKFTFNGTGLEGTSTVVFEDLYENDVKIAAHSNIKDEGQTIHFPEVKTNAKDRKTQDEVGETAKETTIVDKVSYHNLIPGKEYTVKGTLMDQSTGKPIQLNGKNVTSKTTFTAYNIDGTVDMIFTFDASALKGKTTVVFEDLYLENIKVAAHADIEDHDQTIWHPEMKTSAKDSKSDTHEAKVSKKVTIIDTVTYHNLVVGKEYTIKGTLMNKATGKPIRNGLFKVTAESTFTPKETDGSIDMTFTFDASKLEGADVVVFEDLLHNKVVVTSHADLKDKDQTIHFPKTPDTPETPKTPGTPTTPSGGTPPKTGDNSNLWIYLALMGAASAGIAGMVLKRRKNLADPEDLDE